VIGQTVVELGRDSTHLRQTVVRNVREVVVLDVVAEIVDEEIQRTVVAGRRLTLREQIVLRDEVTRQRMKTQSKQRPDEQVYQRFDAEKVEDQSIEADLDEEVDDLEREKRNWVLNERSNAVDSRVYSQPQQLSGPVTKHSTFKRRRDVDVLNIVSVNNTIS